MDKLFQATAWGAKATSDYKQDKNEAQQKKAKEVADAKAEGQWSDPKAKDKPKGCWGCGKPWKDQDELKKHQASCPVKKKIGSGCKREVATLAHCIC